VRDAVAAADQETDPEAKGAFLQLAEEFKCLTQEIEGLIRTYEALTNRRVAGAESRAVGSKRLKVYRATYAQCCQRHPTR
jgi:hypothetical protein